jgi:hypothetical protein
MAAITTKQFNHHHRKISPPHQPSRKLLTPASIPDYPRRPPLLLFAGTKKNKEK